MGPLPETIHMVIPDRRVHKAEVGTGIAVVKFCQGPNLTGTSGDH